MKGYMGKKKARQMRLAVVQDKSAIMI